MITIYSAMYRVEDVEENHRGTFSPPFLLILPHLLFPFFLFLPRLCFLLFSFDFNGYLEKKRTIAPPAHFFSSFDFNRDLGRRRPRDPPVHLLDPPSPCSSFTKLIDCLVWRTIKWFGPCGLDKRIFCDALHSFLH